MHTVFLVDDHDVVRRQVAEMLDREPDLVVVGQAGSVADALARIPVLAPDIAVLDLRLSDGDGVELCRELRARMPQLNCVMLTACTDHQSILRAILAGACGYVIKDVQGRELMYALRMIGAGLPRPDTAAVLAGEPSGHRPSAGPPSGRRPSGGAGFGT